MGAELELFGDLGVGATLGEQHEDLALALGERLAQLGGAALMAVAGQRGALKNLIERRAAAGLPGLLKGALLKLLAQAPDQRNLLGALLGVGLLVVCLSHGLGGGAEAHRPEVVALRGRQQRQA